MGVVPEAAIDGAARGRPRSFTGNSWIDVMAEPHPFEFTPPLWHLISRPWPEAGLNGETALGELGRGESGDHPMHDESPAGRG
jgi:hypothetical protein